MTRRINVTRDSDPVATIWQTLLGAKWTLRRNARGFVEVIGSDGTVIGDAHRAYSDGWAVHTRPYGGYVPDTDVEWIA